MKRVLLAMSAMAALTVGYAGTVRAQDVDDPGYISPDRDRGFREERGMRGREDCHLVIMHRRTPDGSVTVRRRVCD